MSHEADEITRQPWILAMDTATDQAGVAVAGDGYVSERSWPAGRQQTVALLPVVVDMLSDAGKTLADLAAVAVTIGPGSFTGLRVGLSIAKGIAIAHNCALIGIPTLDVVASPLLEAGDRCVVAAPAGRGRVIWAAYHGSETATPTNATFADFVASLSGYSGWLVAGEFSEVQRTSIGESGVRLASRPLGQRRASVLAEIASRRWMAGESDDPVLLEPAYLHGGPNNR